jgi:DNA-binding response OmpR family regulator
MTAYAMEGDREKCLKCGMNDYISKPITSRDIEKTIERWLTDNDISHTNSETEKIIISPEIFDPSFLTQQLGGDKQTALTIFKCFTEDTAQQLLDLENAIKSNNIQVAVR